ncbi:MAG: thioesterase II family protein [Oscillospiraceae bacterium]
MKLMILPHAGGSARGYCVLKKMLPADITLVPLEPAGRGARNKEACFEDISLCAADILKYYGEDIWEGDYALFGHSMGTLLVTELARLLSERGFPPPKHVFLSGRCAADEQIDLLHTDNPSDEEVVEFFARNNLVPEAILNNKEMLSMFSKVIGADVRMAGSYVLSPEQYQFPCDISVFYGTDDLFLKECGVEGWKHFTNHKCNIYSFPGGHFYYTEQKEAVCARIAENLHSHRKIKR